MRMLVASMLFCISIGGCGSGTSDENMATDAGGGSTSGGRAGSCMGGKETGCTLTTCCQDYMGTFTPATAQSSCGAISGTYSADPCPVQDRVGSCALYQATAAEQIVRYYSGYVVPDHVAGGESASSNCSALHVGVFTPN